MEAASITAKPRRTRAGLGDALGTYSIDENGDTTLSDYGGYRVEGGKLVFDRAIKAEAV